MYILSKKRSLVLTPDKIYVFNKKDFGNPRYMHEYSDILGISLSLRMDAKNLIVHFGTKADEQWFTE